MLMKRLGGYASKVLEIGSQITKYSITIITKDFIVKSGRLTRLQTALNMSILIYSFQAKHVFSFSKYLRK